MKLLERRAITYRNNSGYDLTVDHLDAKRTYTVERYRISSSSNFEKVDSTEQRGPRVRLHAELPPPGVELIVLKAR